MRSKTSKPSRKPRPRPPPEFRLWKAANACSEEAVGLLARELALGLAPGHRILLEGPMGVGKTTFSRKLLEALGVEQPPEGSPSFAIAHEYTTRAQLEVIHLDFYRLRSEAEIQDAGVEAYFWERSAVVLAEWTSLWPVFESSLWNLGSPRGPNLVAGAEFQVWKVELGFVPTDPALRTVTIKKLWAK